jgi:NTP pyrophosphatase (non-canonical NTP hydrolase)
MDTQTTTLTSADDLESDLNSYQVAAAKTAVYPGRGTTLGFLYTALALGEAGEIQGKAKKVLRDTFKGKTRQEIEVLLRQPLRNVISIESRQAFKREFGDLLWEFSQCCFEAGFTLQEVADDNLRNLKDRQNRGVLHGSGDTR